jgi:hypothetical protein
LNEITPDKQRRLAQPSFGGQVSVLGAKARKVGARVFEIGDPKKKKQQNKTSDHARHNEIGVVHLKYTCTQT